MTPASLITMFLAYANRLKFSRLFIITTGLFVIDLLIPDFIPLIDEFILGLIAIILANWKKEHRLEKQSNVIEGEIISEKDRENHD